MNEITVSVPLSGIDIPTIVKRALENPNFRRWFDGSKVLDDKGLPLVVYHGTYGNIKRFYAPEEMPEDLAEEVLPYGQHTFGIYLTDKKQFAGKFGNNVLPLYVALKTPLDLRTAKTFEELATQLGIDTKKNSLTLRNMKNDSYFLDEGFRDDIYRALESLVNNFNLIPGLKSKKYDGIIFKDREDNIYGNTYVAFYSTQIKSIFNRGTFNPDDPDIMK